MRKRSAKVASAHERRAYMLQYRFGVTPEQYEELLEAQNYQCAICGRPHGTEKRSATVMKGLGVDHNHHTGAVRGLLCSTCNGSLGYLGDSVYRLRRAMEYLERYEGGRTQLDADALVAELCGQPQEKAVAHHPYLFGAF